MNLCSELARVILILVPSCGHRMGSELSAIVLRLYGGRGGLGLTHVSVPAGSRSGGLLLKPGQVLGSESTESYQLDHQGIPSRGIFEHLTQEAMTTEIQGDHIWATYGGSEKVMRLRISAAAS